MSECDTKEYDIIIYHRNCADGFASAWVAWTFLKNGKKYFAMNPQDTKLPLDIIGKNVLMVDITFLNEETMNYLRKKTNRLCIIDHHIQAKKTLRKQDSYIFTEKNSAAVITWKYFYPNEIIPTFLQFIEVGDLLLKNVSKDSLLKYSQYFNAALTFKYPYKNIKLNEIEQRFKKFSELKNKENLKEVIKTGIAISGYKEDLIENNCFGSIMKFHGYKVIVHNFSTVQLRNDIGNMLAVKNKDKADFAVTWAYEHIKKRYSISLRNPINKKTINMDDIARKYGCGGHPGAATFYYKGNIFDLFEEI